MKEKARTLITGDELSAPNQVFPLPSDPDGHRIFSTFVKPASVEEGDASMSASCSGTGTREDEKGVAPAEKGTLGLLVPFKTAFPLPNDVRNEPEKNKLASEEFVVMEVTSAWAPETPPNGALDQVPALGSKMAMACPGDEKLPPAHSVFPLVSQKRALTWPLGPPDPRAAKAPDEGVYEAMLAAGTLLTEEKLPAR